MNQFSERMNEGFWDLRYLEGGELWGEHPGEVVKYMTDFIRNHPTVEGCVDILDIGCGYGRDSIYLKRNLNCNVLGIDPSPVAIRMAKEKTGNLSGIEFRNVSYQTLANENRTFDIIVVSNLYHLLTINERNQLIRYLKQAIRKQGMLFLGTMSVNDREDYGKGESVKDDLNSFERVPGVIMHFSSRDELEREFGFLKILELTEITYDEFHEDGNHHHHTSWIMSAIKG